MPRKTLRVGPLTAVVREYWVLAADRRVSAGWPNWTERPTVHTIAVESVDVRPAHRQQGHFRRFLEAVCRDPRFALVSVEQVQNPDLAAALARWGWECDRRTMCFYGPPAGWLPPGPPLVMEGLPCLITPPCPESSPG